MPNFEPTRATATVSNDGSILVAHPGVVHRVKCMGVDHVSCLIMPDWRPIEEAPKDGRMLMLFCGESIVAGKWSDFYKDWIASGNGEALYAIVRPTAYTAMLPPPAPRGEEVKP